MEEVQNEEILTDSLNQTAEEKTGDKAEISLGKFKDVNALLNAYNSLEAEFTKRCQKIKELEGKTDKEESSPVDMGESQKDIQKGVSQQEKEDILKDYLKGIIGDGNKVVFLDGDGVITKTKSEKPKTIDEAGSLAKSIFNN